VALAPLPPAATTGDSGEVLDPEEFMSVSTIRASKTGAASASEYHARVDELLPLIAGRADEAERIG
jgi:hypothetical protein